TVYGSRFMVHSPIRTSLKIYNIRGELVRTLVDEPKEAGKYEATWDGKDEDGNQVASGIYFYQLRTNDYCQTKKMILVK
ncbi:MAG: FlgD immunoglobulin-like domain containing protein, partial [Candidatus Zixiibacteriota bacterium]